VADIRRRALNSRDPAISSKLEWLYAYFLRIGTGSWA